MFGLSLNSGERGDLCRNSGECQGGSSEHDVVGSPRSPNFAMLRQSSHEGARSWLHSDSQRIIFQGAAKGGRQKEFDHFFSFSGLFRSLF